MTVDVEIPGGEEVPIEETVKVDMLLPEIDPDVGGEYVVGGFCGT